MGKGNNYGDRRREYGGASPDDFQPEYSSRARYDQPVTVRSGPEVSAKVKWFNAEKGFGFVELPEGSGDAFLHIRQVEAIGRATLDCGVILTIRVGPGQKGTQVTEILRIDEAAALPTDVRRDAPGLRSRGHVEGNRDGVKASGSVRAWNVDRGFGFVAVPGQPKDIFVHVSALARTGVTELRPGQRVTVQIVSGRKGLEAGSIELD